MCADSYELDIPTRGQNDIVNLTAHVEEVVEEAETREGICVVFCPHTTASVIVNEDDDNLEEDMIRKLYDLVSQDDDYRHGEDEHEPNAHAHIKALLTGNSVTIPVIENELRLGEWQDLMLLETDGPREREIVVQVFGE